MKAPVQALSPTPLKEPVPPLPDPLSKDDSFKTPVVDSVKDPVSKEEYFMASVADPVKYLVSKKEPLNAFLYVPLELSFTIKGSLKAPVPDSVPDPVPAPVPKENSFHAPTADPVRILYYKTNILGLFIRFCNGSCIKRGIFEDSLPDPILKEIQTKDPLKYIFTIFCKGSSTKRKIFQGFSSRFCKGSCEKQKDSFKVPVADSVKDLVLTKEPSKAPLSELALGPETKEEYFKAPVYLENFL